MTLTHLFYLDWFELM